MLAYSCGKAVASDKVQQAMLVNEILAVWFSIRRNFRPEHQVFSACNRLCLIILAYHSTNRPTSKVIRK